ncbi:MAG: hypothetical protein J0H34_22600 [Rhizobiales bacterium]|nr:hypothetical protein [Hyphomicrobiales bacterium]
MVNGGLADRGAAFSRAAGRYSGVEKKAVLFQPFTSLAIDEADRSDLAQIRRDCDGIKFDSIVDPI